MGYSTFIDFDNSYTCPKCNGSFEVFKGLFCLPDPLECPSCGVSSRSFRRKGVCDLCKPRKAFKDRFPDLVP